ncbi:hypothetical protein B0H10DRAFT_1949695 [Mycena sp. CBHHK59/15]|nr:hypothetical protein B0H10DRAFT_1949695 [Mycena sp. CBHHK59/15]
MVFDVSTFQGFLLQYSYRKEGGTTRSICLPWDEVNILGIYVICIVQPGANPVTHTPASLLTCRYAYERDLLAFIPQGGFGIAYIHYARYQILCRIASEVGLQINKPSQESSVDTIRLTYLDLLGWAGVNAGSFGNEKSLIMRSEQVQWELLEQRNLNAADAVLLSHLSVLDP